MALSLIVFSQMVIMFLLMIVGVIGYKTKLITNSGTEQLVKILLYIVNVGVVLSAYNKKYEPRLAKGLLVAMGLAVVTHLVGIVISRLVWRKSDVYTNSVLRFSVIYSNCGFMAIPIISAVFNEQGVFYSGAYIIVFNVFMWTQGVLMMNTKTSLKESAKRFLNPVLIAALAGIAIFFLGIPIPQQISEVFTYIAKMNTPIAMIIAGIYIIRSDVLSAFKMPKIYLAALLRLIVVPCIMAIIIKLLKVDGTVAVTVLIASACPSATTNMLFASRFGTDKELAVHTFCLSTLLSIITVPFMVWFYGVIPL